MAQPCGRLAFRGCPAAGAILPGRDRVALPDADAFRAGLRLFRHVALRVFHERPGKTLAHHLRIDVPAVARSRWRACVRICHARADRRTPCGRRPASRAPTSRRARTANGRTTCACRSGPTSGASMPSSRIRVSPTLMVSPSTTRASAVRRRSVASADRRAPNAAAGHAEDAQQPARTPLAHELYILDYDSRIG